MNIVTDVIALLGHAAAQDRPVAMAAAAPTVPSRHPRQPGGWRRHPWLSVLWTAARTPRGATGLALAVGDRAGRRDRPVRGPACPPMRC